LDRSEALGIQIIPIACIPLAAISFWLQRVPSGTTIGITNPFEGIPMNVGDIIGSRREIFSIRDDTTVHDAARYLRDHRVRAVGILDADGRLVGAISQSDISDKVAAENKCPAWMRVSEIMTRALVTVAPERTLDECLREMKTHGIFHLIVIDAGGNFQGMISVTDLLEIIASDHKARADLFEAFLFPPR
jgi:CBS domain-containing protein